MAFTTLADVKAYLSITGTSKDDMLNAMIDATTTMVVSLIGYDPTKGTKTEQISLCDFRGNELYLHTPNVISIDKINGIVYTGVLGTDYIITRPNLRKLIINNLYLYTV